MEKEPEPRLAPPSLEDNDEFFHRHFYTVFVIVPWVICIWELYLRLRQRSILKKLTTMPSILDGILTPEVYEKSRVYSLEKNTFGIVHLLYSGILDTIFVVYWATYFMWIWGADLVEYVGLNRNNELYVTAGCITIMRIASEILSDLPFTVYSTFVLEQKHNFNNQTALFFIKDQISKFIVSHVLMVPLVCVMIFIIKNGGDYFFVYLWMFTVIISLLLMMIYPEFIAPLFDKYTPLPEGELKERIEALAASLGFPLYKLYIVEGSRRSTHSNAYLYGFHKHKRIVLFDTLVAEYQRKKEEEKSKDSVEVNNEDTKKKEVIKEKEIRGCETDEIIAVLGHELGHWHHSHALKNFIIVQVVFLVNFILFAQLLNYTPIYQVFGFFDSQPVLVGLMVVLKYVLGPSDKLLGWAMTAMTRRFEFQADTFACKLGHADALRRALIKLHKDNLGFPIYDWLFSNWNCDHPPLLERLDAMKKDD